MSESPLRRSGSTSRQSVSPCPKSSSSLTYPTPRHRRHFQDASNEGGTSHPYIDESTGPGDYEPHHPQRCNYLPNDQSRGSTRVSVQALTGVPNPSTPISIRDATAAAGLVALKGAKSRKSSCDLCHQRKIKVSHWTLKRLSFFLLFVPAPDPIKLTMHRSVIRYVLPVLPVVEKVKSVITPRRLSRIIPITR